VPTVWKFKKYILKSMKIELQWSNSHLHRTFLSWDIKCWSLFTKFKMIDCAIICDVIVVLLKLQSTHFLVFWKLQFLVPKCNRFLTALGWLLTRLCRPSLYSMSCKKTGSVQGHINIFNFKRKQSISCQLYNKNIEIFLRNDYLDWSEFKF